MSPKLAIVEVAVGTDRDEFTGVDAGGGVGPGEGEQPVVGDATTLLGVSYRQAKRLWRRFARGGASALGHGQVGRASNRGTAVETRERVLALIRERYSGDVATRFGPTLMAEHLVSEDGLTVDHETLRRWMLSVGLWSRERKRPPIGNGVSARRTSASSYSSMVASTRGMKHGDLGVA